MIIIIDYYRECIINNYKLIISYYRIIECIINNYKTNNKLSIIENLSHVNL